MEFNFNITSNTHMYGLYDKLSHNITHLRLAETPDEYVREMVAHRVSFPMTFDDFVVYDFGSADRILEPEKEISWSVWRFPETKAELLKPLGLSQEELTETIKRSDEADEKYRVSLEEQK